GEAARAGIRHPLVGYRAAVIAAVGFSESKLDVERDIIGKNRIEVSDHGIDGGHEIISLRLWGVGDVVKGSIDLHFYVLRRSSNYHVFARRNLRSLIRISQLRRGESRLRSQPISDGRYRPSVLPDAVRR